MKYICKGHWQRRRLGNYRRRSGRLRQSRSRGWRGWRVNLGRWRLRRQRSVPRSRARGRPCSRCRVRRMRWRLVWLIRQGSWRRSMSGRWRSWWSRWLMQRSRGRRQIGRRYRQSQSLISSRPCWSRRLNSWRRHWRIVIGGRKRYPLNSKIQRKTSLISTRNRLQL